MNIVVAVIGLWFLLNYVGLGVLICHYIKERGY